MKQNDTLWKGILEPFFYDFLSLVDPKLAATIDNIREITFMDKELVQQRPAAGNKYEQKIVDKLVKLYTITGNEEYIILHLEVQDQYRKNFNERMYGYFNRLYDKYKTPITALAIFTEPNNIERDNVFKINCNGTSLQYTFNTYKIALQDNNALMQHSNPFALVVLIAKQTALKKKYKDKQLRDEVLLAEKLKIARLIMDKQLPEAQKESLMNFLFYYVNFEFKNNQFIFEQRINQLTSNITTNMTIQEILIGQAKLQGKRLGKKEEREGMIAKMISNNATDEQILNLTEVTPALVSRVRKRIEKSVRHN
ncbi:hypothetical protein SAMN06265348_10174 [Pedobacter westerhofensis]|uniref:Transposase (putative) YhgA-like domain-containing protein n=1 Tax=Pedobacter westerhofensis TaxID=425512 RepID=A0A521AD41_9SPHI|nr:hypothetical protein [Pedobacter westerhofensis]SMO32744.1 hypothetical protein SAMN06265348_10174 [Pedobacter westerhofensis]